MKVSDLKLNQEVQINNKTFLYKGIQKIKMSGFGKVQKIVFENKNIKSGCYYLNLHEGNRTLKIDGNGTIKL